MSRERLSTLIVLAALFLLPWQTRWIFGEMAVDGQTWEYGRLSLYATEALILLATFLRGRLWLSTALQRFARPLVFFVAATLIAASLSQNVTLALGALLHVVAAAALFGLVADDRTNLRHAAWAFVLGLIVPCGLAWLQVTTGASPSSTLLGLASHDAATLGASVVETETGRILRGYGTFPHPNVFGGFLAVGLVLCAWLVRQVPAGRSRLLFAAPIVVLASTLVITFSRSAWLAAATAFIALALLMLFNRKTAPRHAIPFATLGMFAFVVTLAVFHVALFTRFQPAARLEAQSISERAGEYPVWDDVVRVAPITGVGPANYTYALATLYPGREIWSYQPIHNAALLFLAETGIVGLAMAAYAVSAIVGLFRPWKPSAGAIFGVTLLVLFVPVAFLDHYLWSLWPGLALGAFGLAMALRIRGT